MLPKISNTAQGMVNIAMGLHKIASKQNIDKISYIYLFKIIMCILFKVLYFCLTKNIYLIKKILHIYLQGCPYKFWFGGGVQGIVEGDWCVICGKINRVLPYGYKSTQWGLLITKTSKSDLISQKKNIWISAMMVGAHHKTNELLNNSISFF